MALSTDNLEVLYRQGSEVTRTSSKVCHGAPPAVALCKPKYPHNVGGVVRAASCFGIGQVWYTGNRVRLEGQGRKYRLPREERMKGYADVKLFNYNYFFDQFQKACTPVAVELRYTAEDLRDFEHPADSLYVFGPEDGSIPKMIMMHCHRFVRIPSKHCLNLSQAVNIVLYDRLLKGG